MTRIVITFVGEEAQIIADALRMRLSLLDAFQRAWGADRRVAAERTETARLMLRVAGKAQGTGRRSGGPASVLPASSVGRGPVKSSSLVGPRSDRGEPSDSPDVPCPVAEIGPTGREENPEGSAPPPHDGGDGTGVEHE